MVQKTAKKSDIKQTAIYTAVFFTITVLYCVVKGFKMESDSILYSLYLGDFSIGYCSRFLIGEIISWFKPEITREWLTDFLRIVTFTVFGGICFYSAMSVVKAKQESKDVILIFAGLLFVSPYAIQVHSGIIFEFIDIFCLAAMMLCLYFCANKYIIWLVPFLLVTGIFIHDAFLTSYLAPCLGFAIYFSIKKYGTQKWTWFLFALCVMLSLSSGIYTVIFARETITMSESQMLSYMAERGNCTVEELKGYIETFTHYTDTRGVSGLSHAGNIFEVIQYMFVIGIRALSFARLLHFVAVLPIIVLTFFVWIKAAKNADGFLRKLPYILFMLCVLPQILSIFMSNDFDRYLSVIPITQILFLFMCTKQNDENVQVGLDFLSQNKHCFALPVVLTFLTNIL